MCRTLVRLYHVGSGLDNLPERAVCRCVVDATALVWTFLLEHTETDKAAEFVSCGALGNHFARRFGLEEAHPIIPDYPERQLQPGRPPEELLSHLACIQRRVPNDEITNNYLESR